MKGTKSIFTVVVVSLLLMGSATAVTWLDFQDGTAGREFTGWTHGAFGGFDMPPSVGVTGGANLAITGDTSGEPFGVYAALFSTDAFAGNMLDYQGSGTEVLGMSMDLTGGTPSGLGFYFASSADGVWFYDILGTPDPGRYSVSFGSAGWSGHGANDWTGAAGDFNTALQNVTQHGFFIYFNQNQNQTYGAGDFGLTVPEPETYMILGMALLSVAVVFRKRITDSLVEARAMLQV